jgi:catechol 2,3-dioxygenase-like lactoylglutathione lyase family enzyme
MPLPADIIGLDHVQVAAPKGSERKARHFYGGVLGMEEVPKPRELKKRGGCWFRCGATQLHVGIAEDFQPAVKAHPAFAVASVSALAARLRVKGVDATDPEEIAGRRRLFVNDPFGNRLEFTEPPPREARQFGT